MSAERHLLRSVLDALSGLPLFATAPLCRRRHLRWGATDDEVRGPMPGDDLVPRASFNATRGITIAAPPQKVWPWIVQMGYKRAGFYSYALLDNAGHESPSVVLDEFQDPQVGDWMPMSGTVNETTAFRVPATRRKLSRPTRGSCGTSPTARGRGDSCRCPAARPAWSLVSSSTIGGDRRRWRCSRSCFSSSGTSR